MIEIAQPGNDPKSQPVAAPSGLLLVFEEEQRPSSDTVRRAIARIDRASISHDPALARQESALNGHLSSDEDDNQSSPANAKHDAWLELLIDGLTFDLLGLSPGIAIEVPPIVHRFAADAIPPALSAAAIALAPGPHLSGAGHTLPVVKAMLGLSVGLGSQLEECLGVYWHPARSLMGLDYFTRITNDWLKGGAFPALGLTGFARTARGELMSEGLSFFTGQELRLDAAFASDLTAATRLAIRLVHQLVSHGALEEMQRVTAPDGSSLTLTPVEDNRIVAVSAK